MWAGPHFVGEGEDGRREGREGGGTEDPRSLTYPVVGVSFWRRRGEAEVGFSFSKLCPCTSRCVLVRMPAISWRGKELNCCRGRKGAKEGEKEGENEIEGALLSDDFGFYPNLSVLHLRAYYVPEVVICPKRTTV